MKMPAAERKEETESIGIPVTKAVVHVPGATVTPMPINVPPRIIRGIISRRGVISEVFKKGDTLYVRGEDTFLGETFEEEADMVVLAAGLVQRKGLEVIEALGVQKGEDRFFRGPSPLDPVESGIEGVYLAGCCVGPKDIPDTVVQASGAASRAMAVLAKAGSSTKEAAA